MENNSSYRNDILECVEKRINHMIGKHNKVLFVRFDVRYPQGYPHNGTNSDMSKLMKLLKEPYTERKVSMHYVWAREQDSSDAPHYHVAMMANGSRVQNPGEILNNAGEVWGRVTGSNPSGLIDFCCHDFNGQPSSGHVMIRRPSSLAKGKQLDDQTKAFENARAEALQRGRYLAKTRTKGHAPKRVREYQGSQL
ncbi:YagK/YfjJ domain-containing protein [Azospirillum argentinense]